jgi:ParB-like nuclease domain
MGIDRQYDFDGQVGNRDHITRRVHGTVPTSAIAEMHGARGEIPGTHRNRQGEHWEAFKEDIRQHGIKEPIFIIHDHGDVPRISEGNHRRDAAVELGMKEVPFEMSHFGHSELPRPHGYGHLFNDRR